MRKLLAYSVLLLAAFLWYLGFAGAPIQWLINHGIIQDEYRYGDLYRFSNLPEFKKLRDHCPQPDTLKKLPVKLTLFGDSFTEEVRLDSSHFVADKYFRRFVAQQHEAALDPARKNVLIIQTVERHFRERFDTVYTNVKLKPIPQPSKTLTQELLDIRVPYSEEQQAMALFASDWAFALREFKARLTRRLFQRVHPDVVLSPNGKHIFYSLPVNPGPNSIFDPIADSTIARYVANMNATYDYYKKAGYDEVIFSVIPNKVTILGQNMGRYNHLVERVQQHPALRVPFIDMYQPLMAGGEKLFDAGDTHWNCAGKYLWVNEVNKRLKAISY